MDVRNETECTGYFMYPTDGQNRQKKKEETY